MQLIWDLTEYFLDLFDPSNAVKIFLALKWVFEGFDSCVLERVTGHSLVRGSKREQQEAAARSCSAHFMDIRARRNVSNPPTISSYKEHFILTHNKYGDPREILQEDKITLYEVTSSEAIFTVSDVDVYDTRMNPFCFTGQYLTSRH